MITFVYDWLRIVRRVIPHKQFVVSLEDFFFWVFCAIYVFLWMYRFSNGSMRWFAVAGALFGMYLYKKLLSGFLVTYVSKLLKYILGLLGKVLSLCFRPLRFIGRKLSKVQSKARKHRRKLLGNFKIWLKSRLKALKIRVTRQ
ncbi:MAG: spore cortex biosynthesis protein YabQ [Lachnospiraceae bacterium]|nr:spore cortex biosynthesis protein YabQ [Lachnospiraceae bacterium]